MGDAVTVTGLVKDYGTLHAVAGIDLTIHEGEVFAFLGPNGAGKTTTVEILEGLRPRTSGDVSVLGMDPWVDAHKLIQRIGVIPQGFNFFEKINPTEAINFYAGLFGKKVDANALLKKVELEDKAKDLFENLSGGQKQKLGLALSMVHDPELLFLDEPTTGLDPQARRAIWDVIRDLKARGKTIFLTTHYLEEAQILADRVAIINSGKIIVTGTPVEIIEKYGKPEVVLLEAPPSLADYLRKNMGLRVVYRDNLVEAEVGSKNDVLKVLNYANMSGIPWRSVSTHRDTLEDVFIRLVGKMDEGTVAGSSVPEIEPKGGSP
jgi:ABC-2 type transport system ATP-binding protein